MYAANYGVVGDGVTNAAVILQDLVNTLSAAGGAHIVLPAGNIVLNDHVRADNNVTISDAGMDSTILKPLKTGIHYAETPGGQSDPIRNFHVRDLTIDGVNQIGAYKGIAMQYLIGCSFQNLRIKNTQMTGVGIDFVCDSYVANVITEDTGPFQRRHHAGRQRHRHRHRRVLIPGRVRAGHRLPRVPGETLRHHV